MCALLLHSNGITEEYKPNNYTFTEEELVSLFQEFTEIKTNRLVNVVNTWCIYGYSPNFDPLDLNRIASEIVKEPVYSSFLFVHDSEINPKWNATETILYKNYEDFLEDIKKEVERVANIVIYQLENSEEYIQKTLNLPYFETIGITNENPKRLLIGFNPTTQSEDFYKNEEFYQFSQKVYDFISRNRQEKEPFTIYADKKSIIIINSKYVVQFLTSMLEKFKSKEDYEICNDISDMIKTWMPKNKRIIKKNNKENKENKQ